MNLRSPWFISAVIIAAVLIVLAIVAPSSAIVAAVAVLIPATLRFTTPLLFAALGGDHDHDRKTKERHEQVGDEIERDRGDRKSVV